ncbi:hypothetical protein [Methylobacterium segetis]|uniref:hypothetical protein n=1 Tax=Methylobacterium segetis TaxID=2488750 RepID=UPI001A9D9878|nr:hypothetical protein [Methylobacterium segetis]
MPKSRAPDRTTFEPAADAPPEQADVERAIEAALQRLRPAPRRTGKAAGKAVGKSKKGGG